MLYPKMGLYFFRSCFLDVALALSNISGGPVRYHGGCTCSLVCGSAVNGLRSSSEE